MPEGTLAFPHEPLLRVTGPLLQAQLLETRAAQPRELPDARRDQGGARRARGGRGPVMEFGLRRAQGPDGGLTASRGRVPRRLQGDLERAGRPTVRHPGARDARPLVGAVVRRRAGGVRRLGGASCPATPCSWSTPSTRRRASRTRSRPGSGCASAASKLAGIRLDSGDLAYLSVAGARAARRGRVRGHPDRGLERPRPATMESLQAQGARIDSWGVGTKLVTCYDQPALGGVYKLARDPQRRPVADAGQGQRGHREDHRPRPAARSGASTTPTARPGRT